MALVVEDGTGLDTAEAYISVTDADAYHAARGHSDWASATTPLKEQSLRIGAQYIDSAYMFKGKRTNEVQSMAWPREGASDFDYNIANNTIPARLKNANAEAALLLVQGTDLQPNLDRGGNIYKTREKVGPIEEETTYTLSASGYTTFSILNNLLAALVGSYAGNRKIIRS